MYGFGCHPSAAVFFDAAADRLAGGAASDEGMVE